MNNLLPRIIPMHIKYDLKGSTYKRRASPKEREKAVPTHKDLDFIQDLPDGLLLEADNFNAMCKTIQRDCLVSDRETSLLLIVSCIKYHAFKPLIPCGITGHICVN